VALARDREHLLALKRAGRLCECDESEKRAHCGETNVAGPRRTGALLLEVIEECSDERRIKILQAQFRRRPRQAR
jgi:hypothetical protein